MPNCLDTAFTFMPSSVMASRASHRVASVQFPILCLAGISIVALLKSTPLSVVLTSLGVPGLSSTPTLLDCQGMQLHLRKPSSCSLPCDAPASPPLRSWRQTIAGRCRRPSLQSCMAVSNSLLRSLSEAVDVLMTSAAVPLFSIDSVAMHTSHA